ncbi:CAP domain-containing protein [Bacillus sp. FJAT-45066]|uniref:CAP domain-containing protein n=1 Tax=Bacillus sp. FJAT-45066 TaxID=2011010 RepID=UPI000BB96371|nr:CAP domain-containing protein [Bacillus sp. FJAT-45066]
MRGVLFLLTLSFVAIIFIQYQPNITDENVLTDTEIVEELVVVKKEIDTNESEVKDTIELNGIGLWIGKSVYELKEHFGEPNRIDLSAYDYDWYIYNEDLHKYVQFGIQNEEIVTIFVVGDQINNQPFIIGEQYEALNVTLNFEEQLQLSYESGSYRFQLSEEELQVRPIIELENIYVQLYFDSFEGTLSSVRYLNAETLLKQRPYELVYRGSLIDAKSLSPKEWELVEKGANEQILDFTNIIRERFNLTTVQWDEETAKVAYNHSKDMSVNEYFSHTSPTTGGLSERLTESQILYRLAGENIAAKYVDGLAAVEGWLNSEGHRNTLLNERFTHLGVGVYEKYYTQNFIQSWR